MASPPAPRQPGVIVADDGPGVRALLSAFLRQAGFAVWEAASGEEAVATLQAHPQGIDAALLDPRMPAGTARRRWPSSSAPSRPCAAA
jgi:CheY-like chemotaxis protein